MMGVCGIMGFWGPQYTGRMELMDQADLGSNREYMPTCGGRLGVGASGGRVGRAVVMGSVWCVVVLGSRLVALVLIWR